MSIRAPASRFTTLATLAFALAALYLAREVLQPLALATLIAFLLAPAVRGLERLGSRRSVAVVAVATAAFLALALVAWLVTVQVLNLAHSVDHYRANLLAKVHSLQHKPGVMARAGAVVGELGRAFEGGDGAASHPPSPVAVTQADPPLERLARILSPLLIPVSFAIVVAILVIFFLLQREDLRDRLLRLAGEDQLLLTTRAMDDAGQRVSRYLLAQLLVNGLYGLPIGLGLWALGLPNALLWGLIAVILRYLPYVGPWLAAAAPFVLALAVFPDWQRPLLVLALFLVLELAINNFVEPYVYGARVGMSPVALLLAALFWTWLWGPLGLVLAAPLTVCLVVLGRHVAPLGFLAVLFGDEPALPPAARLYQRLLAGDRLEAGALVDEQLSAGSRGELFEEVLLPALALAERDSHRGDLDEARQRFVLATLSELLAELPASERTIAEASAEPPSPPRRAVLGIAARDEADALCASMLLQMLDEGGVAAGTVLPMTLAGEVVEAVAARHPDVILVSALPPDATLRSRYLCKRLAARFPQLPIVVGLWQADERADARQQLVDAGASEVVTTLAAAVTAIARVPA